MPVHPGRSTRITLVGGFALSMLGSCSAGEPSADPAGGVGAESSGGTAGGDVSGAQDGTSDASRGSSGGAGHGGSAEASESGSVDTDAPMNGLYTARVSTIVVEVDYESGAAPYTGNRPGFGDLWDVFVSNAGVLFEENPKELQIERNLEDMDDIGELEPEDFTAAALRELAATHREGRSTDDTRAYYILFVDGYYADDDGRRSGVLGVSVGGGVIGMFKPVIDGASALAPDLVEQTVLVHEFGHASGLVDAGVEPTSEHVDTEHGRHCNDPECVMYWAVDGSSAVVDFVVENLVSSDSTLFGDACIADVRAADRP